MRNKVIILLLEGKTLIENNYELRNQCSLSHHPSADGPVLFGYGAFVLDMGTDPAKTLPVR